jgi:hypothetical protein
MKKLISLILLLVCIFTSAFLTSCGKTELTLDNYKKYVAITATMNDFGVEDGKHYAKITVTAKKAANVEFEGAIINFAHIIDFDHGNGYQTLYAHMSKIIATKGKWVSQGTRIGLVGSTGYSTGPHLHFTVYKNGKMVNPMSVLK